MGAEKGKLITCDRCRDKTIFLKYLKEVGLSNYAGPGTRPEYEDLPKDWLYMTQCGYLCPDCAKEWCTFLKSFFGEEKYNQLAPAWRIQE